MWPLFKKEIQEFFSSLSGYIVVVVFLLLNSLFMWVFRGQMNVLESGYASLDTLFMMAPWVFLFLVPAITMRVFAEEKRTGTLELLLTRPQAEFKVVFAKFFAAWSLVIISLLPTLIFYMSVYFLGNPKGNLDSGGILGSYIGLIFLGGIYAAIGIFCSSITPNQIVAFILAVFLSFSFYLGFNFMANLSGSGELTILIEYLGIDYHYRSISRGVLDSRDLIYFISVIFIFIYFTKVKLISRKW